MNSMDPYPFERWLLVKGLVSLLYKPNGLQDVGNVIEPPDLSFQLLAVFRTSFIWGLH